MQEAFINVQCTEESGQVGTFLTSTREAADRKAISPVFLDLPLLYAWMRQNNWVPAEHLSDKRIPWRVERRAV